MIFLTLFIKLILLGAGFLNRNAAEIILQGIDFKEMGTFYFQKHKNTASAHLSLLLEHFPEKKPAATSADGQSWALSVFFNFFNDKK